MEQNYFDKLADRTEKHRRSLLLVSIAVIVFELGWAELSPQATFLGGLTIKEDHVTLLLALVFVYFAIIYHQHFGLTDLWRAVRSTVQDDFHIILTKRAEKQARSIATPEETYISFKEPSRPPDWPIYARRWQFTYSIGKEINHPDTRDETFLVTSSLYGTAVRAWARTLSRHPVFLECVFPSLISASAFALIVHDFIR